MAQSLFPKFKSSPALQAAMYYARKNRKERLAKQILDDITYSASTPNPDAESGTQGDGENH